MLFQDITLINEDFALQEHAYVGVRGAQIAYVGTEAPREDFGPVYDGRRKLLIPAFYNAHSHLPMALLRGYGEELSLMDWLQTRIFPFEARLTADDIYYGCLMGVAEMLRYGIAGTSEMYIQQDPLGRAFLESGAKANFCVSCVGFGDEAYQDLHFCQEALDAQRNYHGAGEGRLRTEFCLHAEYTSTEKIARGIAETALENASTMHVHVAETASEVAACRERHGGRSPVRYLHDCGLFAVPATAAHCVHLDDEDIAILKEDGVTVASCPKSNLKLASGICPVTALLDAGVNVAIGTDSVASNNNLNMTEEMRFFSLLQKGVSGDPTRVTAAQALYAATRAGALAQQRPDCGLIREGFRADLTVFDLDRVYMEPGYSALNDLLFSASGSDVCLTMVDGKVLYRDGEYSSLDVERLRFEIKARCGRILGELAAETQ